ncbi:TlpA family protein disulfide reductase [Streptomyces rochei]|uniref:TlpA family protein disulfide reductase n=1 Tax=Streptomyces rochei TaxID=1928 RepID=UPI0035314741
MRSPDPSPGPRSRESGPGGAVSDRRLGPADLGADLGARATLVQFSSAFCAPCRATRRVLAEVARMVPGVAHVEVDAEARLELVRSLGVLKTPTVFVLDAAGRIVRRAAGQPRKADVIAALGEAVRVV